MSRQPRSADGAPRADAPVVPAAAGAAGGAPGGQHAGAGKRKPKRSGKRVAVIVIAILAALVLCAVIVTVALAITGRGNLLQLGREDLVLETAESAVTQDSGRTVTHNGSTYRLNENIVSICVMGEDKAAHAPEEGFNGQADAIMVVALDTESGDVSVIAVPRDSMVDVDRNYLGTDEFADTKKLQLCLAYSYGTTDEESSELVCRAVSRILYNIPMDYYFTIDTNAVAPLADVVDGVTLQALQAIPGTSIGEGDTVTLSGDDALRYVQWRDTSRYGTALERQARQQQFIRALGSQLLHQAKGDPGMLIGAVNAVSDYSTTNLGASELGYLASVVAGSGVGSVGMTTLAGEPVHNDESKWEQFILDKEAVYQTVLDVYYDKLWDDNPEAVNDVMLDAPGASDASGASGASSDAEAGR